MSLPLHRRSRSSACWSWDNGYKRTWALLFSSDWVTIPPACRMQLVKENIALNTGTSHLPPLGVWRPTTQPRNPSPTYCRLLQLPIACHKLPSVTVRMHNSVAESWLLCAEDGKAEPLCLYVHLLLRRQMYRTRATQLLSWEFFFFFSTIMVLFILLSTLCSLHQIIILMCVKTQKALFWTLLGRLRILPFSANVMERLDSLLPVLLLYPF